MSTVEQLQEQERASLDPDSETYIPEGFDPSEDTASDGLDGDDAPEGSIEGAAENGGVDDEKPEPTIEGEVANLSLSVGGRKPDAASFKMSGKEIKLSEKTQFAKGTIVTLSVVARVSDVTFRDKVDESGEPVNCTRVHVAKPLSVLRMKPQTALEAAVSAYLEEVEGGEDGLAAVSKIAADVLAASKDEE